MNKTKKIISAFLAVLMIMSFTSLFASAEGVVLTADNVVEWPTVEYKNTDGLYYYEQPIDDGLVLNGGVVTSDGTAEGTVIAGKFVFNYEEDDFPSSGTRKANIKFIPEDLITYSGFEVDSSANVTFVVTKTTPVFEDEINNPLIATEVEAGATLANSTLSGGKVVNPYNANAPKLATKSWSWSDKKTVVTESGYYEAKLTCPSYNTIYAQVYVRVAGDDVVVEIEEMPTIADVKYKEGLTAGDLTISGGKASVAGEFKVKDASQPLIGGKNTVAVVFVPEDTTLDEVEFSITVTVEKLATYFIDENGNKITPEIKIPYNSTLDSSTLASYVEKLTANCGKFSVSRITPNTIDTSKIAEYEYKSSIAPENSNYISSEVVFKLIIEPKEITPTISAYGNDTYMITTGDYKISPRGTYDLYVNGELVMEDIKYQEEFTWRPEKSGTYNLKAVYNPVENDTYKVNDAVRENMELNLTWKINCINCGAYDYKYGETAKVNHSLGNQFAGWVFYDENGNEFTPENVVADESTSSVKFTMPDFSLTVKAKIVGEADDSVDSDDNSGSAGSTSIFSRFIEFLRNLFEKYINIFKTVFGMFAPAN
ncbi:MAG: hypothetical protein IKM66_07100 [Clostridia bacterium]|nr:hypothetical protein [Clostridia bacterium]